MLHFPPPPLDRSHFTTPLIGQASHHPLFLLVANASMLNPDYEPELWELALSLEEARRSGDPRPTIAEIIEANPTFPFRHNLSPDPTPDVVTSRHLHAMMSYMAPLWRD